LDKHWKIVLILSKLVENLYVKLTLLEGNRQEKQGPKSDF